MSFQHTNSTCNPYKYQWQATLPIQFSGNSFLQVKMPNMPTNLPTYIYSAVIRDCKSPQVFCHYRLFPSHLLRYHAELRLKQTGEGRMLIFFHRLGHQFFAHFLDQFKTHWGPGAKSFYCNRGYNIIAFQFFIFFQFTLCCKSICSSAFL